MNYDYSLQFGKLQWSLMSLLEALSKQKSFYFADFRASQPCKTAWTWDALANRILVDIDDSA